MKPSIKPKFFSLAIVLAILLAGTMIIWVNAGSQKALFTSNQQPEASSGVELTPEPYFPNRDLGVEVPVDVKFNLLNHPQHPGDAAEIELMFTSRLDNAEVEAHVILAESMNNLSGNLDWSGSLGLNETKRLPFSLIVNTDAPTSVQAEITISKGNLRLTRGAAYHFDLGEKDHAGSTEIAVSGYNGGDKLNLIVPKQK